MYCRAMARNGTPKPLTAESTARQRRVHDALSGRLGEVVSLTYVKRNGTPGVSVGAVMYFGGAPGLDTGCVTIDTRETKGRESSVNLHNVLSIDGSMVS